MYPFLRSFFLQVTTDTTTTATARPDTMTGETATVAIETGIGIATRDATETEDTTGIGIDVTTTGGLEDTKEEEEEEEGDIDENARRDLVRDATTKCKLTALQRLSAATVVIEGEAKNAVGMVWALRNEGALLQLTRSHCQ